jgi:hypothetical protein
MALNRFFTLRKPVDDGGGTGGFNEEVENLLESFPIENRRKLSERISGHTPAEQLAILQESLKKRRETLASPRYTSERLQMIPKVPDSVFEDSHIKNANAIEVGRGENGRVFEYAGGNGTGGSTVFKILLRPPMNHQNDLLSEAAYQADVAAWATDHAELGIGVPHPYYVAGSKKGYILAMEKVPGHSADIIHLKRIRLPDGYDYGRLQSALETFVQRMNDAGFYHRDLREGNIMIDPNPAPGAPLAYVIDFGFCVKAPNIEEAYQTVDGTRDHVMIDKVIRKLRKQQELIRVEI